MPDSWLKKSESNLRYQVSIQIYGVWRKGLPKLHGLLAFVRLVRLKWIYIGVARIYIGVCPIFLSSTSAIESLFWFVARKIGAQIVKDNRTSIFSEFLWRINLTAHAAFDTSIDGAGCHQLLTGHLASLEVRLWDQRGERHGTRSHLLHHIGLSQNRISNIPQIHHNFLSVSPGNLGFLQNHRGFSMEVSSNMGTPSYHPFLDGIFPYKHL